MEINKIILSLIVFFPAVGALFLSLPILRGEKALKWAALVISILAFIFSLHLPFHFVSGQPGFQFEVHPIWISHPEIRYHLGIDGISLWLVLLTTFLVPFSVIIQWNSIHGSA